MKALIDRFEAARDQMKAVIDRFEKDKAVLLLGDGEDQLLVPRAALPSSAKVGDWLRVVVNGTTLVSAILDEEETARAKQRIADKLERLRRGDHLE